MKVTEATEVTKVGVLLVNLGTSSDLSIKSIRSFLKEFLSDRRVIEIPAIFWQIILHLFILRFRPKKLKKKYEKIWMHSEKTTGSPLLFFSNEQHKKIAAALDADMSISQKRSKIISTKLAMRYGVPSIWSQLDSFASLKVKHIVVLPLYPQYCAATTASAFDNIAGWMQANREIFGLTFIKDYHDDIHYISACVNAIKDDFIRNGRPKKLIFSFHGMPEITAKKGDPYYSQCLKTVELIVSQMTLKSDEYQITFQSRFGAQKWFEPSTSAYLTNIATDEKIKSVAVFCPGFSADCLETLEEIDQENRSIFMSSGEMFEGKSYRYISALNASDHHITCLVNLIKKYLP